MTTTPTTWRAPFTANASNTAGFQFNPYTIGLSNGNFLVVWTDDTSGTNAGNDVFGQIYGPEGNTVGAAFEVNSSFFVDGEFLGSIAPQTDGGFVIAYVDDEGAGADAIRIERKDAAGVSTFVGSITGGAGAVSDPEITVAPNGSYMVTFTRNIGGDLDVRAVIVSSANVVGAEFDAAQNSADFDIDSDTAGLSNNNFVTVYEEDDAGVTSIEAKIVNSAGTQVSLLGVAGSGTDPHVAALTGGGFAVVWNDTANNGDIRFSVYDNAGTLIANQILVAGGANSQNEPKVVRLLDGGFFVAWDDDTTGALIGRRYSSTGVLVGGNVTIDTGGGITEPELGLTSDGRILVTYSNNSGEISQSILDPRDNVITGTGSSEVLTTQIGNTTIFGGGGLDTIFGQGGDDVIQGGFATDSIFAGSGNDTIQVLEGEFIDHVDGESGTDTLDLSNISSRPANVNLDTGTWDLSPSFGGPATISSIEVVTGTQGNDTITTTFGTQTLNGGLGNDSFVMLEGRFIDEVNGGSGTDTLDLSNITSSPADVNLDTGIWDLVPTFGGPETISSIEVVIGTQGNDTITTTFGTQTLNGGLGDDSFVMLEGRFIDEVNGGSGTDTLDLTNVTTHGATIDLTAGTWDLTPSFGGPQTISSIEIVEGTQLGDSVTGSFADEAFSGKKGDDSLFGGGGTDTIEGGKGDDLIQGGFNTDFIFGENGGDTIAVLEGEFIDNVDGGAGADTLDLSAITSRGAVIDFGAGTWDLSPSFGGPATIVSVERVTGTAVNDSVTGAAANEVFNGGSGDDVLSGAAGLDQLKGGNGNDTLDGGSQADTLEGGGGNDRLTGGTGQDNMTGGGGNDTFVLGPLQADRDTIADFSSAADQFEISAALFGGGLVAGVLPAARFVINATGLAGDSNDRFIYNNTTGQLFYDSNGSAAGNREHIATLTGIPGLASSDFTIV
ncbi:MAG: calcium-binding protein [Enhydrobacter sp.]|nr:calcium-binding protein [Enhydrobacter sp.]